MGHPWALVLDIVGEASPLYKLWLLIVPIGLKIIWTKEASNVQFNELMSPVKYVSRILPGSGYGRVFVVSPKSVLEIKYYF